MPEVGGALRRWWGFPAAGLALAGLVTYAVSAAAATPSTGPSTETVTYEITGPPVAAGIQYGDVYSQAYSPDLATRLARTPLPWRLTVPKHGPISSHDLDARSDPAGVPITCTVRRGDVVVMTKTARGLVGCDTKPW